MASKRKAKRGARRVSTALPKWQRDGFKTYRSYLDARYQSQGYRSYADYTQKREKGEVESTKGKLAHAPEGSAIPAVKKATKELTSVAGMTRISYESECPVEYTLEQKAATQVLAWLRQVLGEIKAAHRKIYSASWRLLGVAIKYERPSEEELEDGETLAWKPWDEWSSHMDWAKMRRNLLDVARAYANHEFWEYGRRVGKTGANVYALLIKSVRISVVLAR